MDNVDNSVEKSIVHLKYFCIRHKIKVQALDDIVDDENKNPHSTMNNYQRFYVDKVDNLFS